MTSDGDTADAIDVLTDIARWECTIDEWQAIERILVAMAAALPEAPVQLTAQLEMASPRRVPRVRVRDGVTDVPAPPAIRERRNQLIDALEDGRSARGSDRTEADKRKK